MNVFFSEFMVQTRIFDFRLVFHQFYSHSIPTIFDRVQIGAVSGLRQTADPILIFPFLNLRVSLEKKNCLTPCQFKSNGRIKVFKLLLTSFALWHGAESSWKMTF